MFLRFIYVVIGIILISAFVGLFTNSLSETDPALFEKGVQLTIPSFFENVVFICQSLFNWDNLTIHGAKQREFSIFLNFWDVYFYSIILFLSSLLLSIFNGVLLTYISMMLSHKMNSLLTRTVSLFESLPDLFIIMIIQFSIVVYYQKTGTLLFPVAGTAQNESYLLPIVALAVIPTILFYRISLHLVRDEWEKPYIDLARSKGFSKKRIFFSHVMRNIIPSLFIHSKTMVLYLLSSMVIFERIFNINGIISYVIRYPSSNIIAFSLILFFVPIFLLYVVLTPMIEKITGQKLEW
ncbi:ABC transporter permease subunit [Paenisporosarcina cavernae]|uniref:ABC transporter permease subunit n=1 Tax=Paenisporosarcina cavernae TaxID=2320858 RepID=UPI001EE53D25|nr:ABC transporter permease subunit [Paenisporosarcina cavernae]